MYHFPERLRSFAVLEAPGQLAAPHHIREAIPPLVPLLPAGEDTVPGMQGKTTSLAVAAVVAVEFMGQRMATERQGKDLMEAVRFPRQVIRPAAAAVRAALAAILCRLHTQQARVEAGSHAHTSEWHPIMEAAVVDRRMPVVVVLPVLVVWAVVVLGQRARLPVAPQTRAVVVVAVNVTLVRRVVLAVLE